ncbi:MAG: hypothetical protein M3Y59_00440 [Myxococcota bacterium]|nr:hypothetical protein [Myxococcota bacterium]
MTRWILLGTLVAALTWIGCTKPQENVCQGSDCDQRADGGFIIPPPSDGGTDAGEDTDGGTDAGDDGGSDAGDDGGTDGGCCTDGGVDGGPTEPVGPRSEWPTDEVKNYSTAYSITRGVRSVGVDDGHNIWLLEWDRIGVLTSEKKSVTWVSGIGQLSSGELAFGTTVVCGGAPGKAYVGYLTDDNAGQRSDPNDPEFQKGDVDLVQLNEDGSISLQVHLNKTTSTAGYEIGIRNTNDWHFDEDKSVFSCVKAYKGNSAGEVFIGTNHGVTRIKGDVYNSHIHPVWSETVCNDLGTNCFQSQRAGYTFALGVAQNGDVLIGNDWMIGRAIPTPDLQYWDRHVCKEGQVCTKDQLTPFRFVTHVEEVNSLQEFDYWRGIAETTEETTWNGKRARYMYLGNQRPENATNPYGLYRMLVTERADHHVMEIVETVKLDFPHMVSGLAATDDGSLFVGTYGDGLYRVAPDKSISKVSSVTGGTVRQIVYDPSATPSMLLVLTDSALWVLRGH